MPAHAGYTFSKKRMFFHLIATLITAGGWFIIFIFWELYRYVNNK